MIGSPESTNTHVTLGDLVPHSAITMDLNGADQAQTINQLLQYLDQDGLIEDRKQAFDDLLTRESRGSTAMGRGVALPHAKTRGARKPALAVGVSRQGVPFNALDGKPVHLVFLFIAPKSRAGLHLKVLSTLSKYLREEENRKRLLEATEQDAVREMLEQIDIG